MKSPATIIFVKILFTIILIVLFYQYFFTTKIEQLVKNQNDIEKISIELRNADRKLKQLTELDKNRQAIENIKKTVYDYWPEEKEASSFIVNIEKTTTAIPLIVSSLNIAEPKTTKTTKTTDKNEKKSTSSNKYLDFTASFSTTYNNSLIFFEKMENFIRYNEIETISLGGYNEEEETLNLTVKGKIFYGK